MRAMHGKTYNINDIILEGQCVMCNKELVFETNDTETTAKASCCGFEYALHPVDLNNVELVSVEVSVEKKEV